MEIFLNLALEMSVLAALGLSYYFFQRHRILHGPRHWRIKKLTELHALGLSCTTPDDYPELHTFLDELEERMQHQRELDREFLSKWKERSLPQELKLIIIECWEWCSYKPA